MSEKDKLSKSGLRTRPWLHAEYMVVDGLRVVYTPDNKTGSLLVHMPGGHTISEEDLRKQGRHVVMPRLLRTDNFV